MGLTPRQIDPLSLWEFSVMYHGWADFHAIPAEAKLSAPSEDEFWAAVRGGEA